MAWLSLPDKSALISTLPAASARLPATRLRATLPEATPAVGVTATVKWLLSTLVTEPTVPLVALKLPVPTVPTTASSKLTWKVRASLVTAAAVSSVTLLTTGVWVSMPMDGVLPAPPGLPATSV